MPQSVERGKYDQSPSIEITPESRDCSAGWPEITARLRGSISPGRFVVCVESYPGVLLDEVVETLTAGLRPAAVFRSEDALRDPAAIEAMAHATLTDDPVFGHLSALDIADFYDPKKLQRLREHIRSAPVGLILVVGTGAILAAPEPDLLVYADLARWNIQLRQRRGDIGNLGVNNQSQSPGLKYKQAFFLDWRAADRLKQTLYDRIAFLLDTNASGDPRMISGDDFRRALAMVAQRPFRVVPFFDPGPWGGQWMFEKFGLPPGPPNYAWCFDCVPEENSLLLGFGSRCLEIPAINLVFHEPRKLLGDSVYSRFGAEFPIRFDLLDTWNGGNLSLQVHPLKSYITENFGIPYTQDESYYMLDAAPDGCVYLGLRDGADRQHMADDLRAAQDGGKPFPAEKYVNIWPARKHDHFSIPAGTIHCSGRNGVVLEISATPYIFTFKLWDWGRLGLNGLPRPVHLDHGLANIQWNRTTEWVRANLVSPVTPVSAGPDWREERTGLHALEFIETRRHWFTGAVPHHTQGNLNVLNLVEGDEAVVESPDGAFPPFLVHYAETFIVPAAVGPYVVRPSGPAERPLATIKAFVRPQE